MRKKILGTGLLAVTTAVLIAVGPAHATSATPDQALQAHQMNPTKVSGKHAQRLCSATKRATRAACYAELLVDDATDAAPASSTRPPRR